MNHPLENLTFVIHFEKKFYKNTYPTHWKTNLGEFYYCSQIKSEGWEIYSLSNNKISLYFSRPNSWKPVSVN